MNMLYMNNMDASCTFIYQGPDDASLVVRVRTVSIGTMGDMLSYDEGGIVTTIASGEIMGTVLTMTFDMDDTVTFVVTDMGIPGFGWVLCAE